MDDRDPVIVAAARTPIGRYGGALREVRPDDLAALVIHTVLERASVRGDDVDEVVFGATNQAGEDNRNVGRMGLLLAGLPDTVPGVTVNRLCGSGLEAVNDAARRIRTGEADVVVAGGVESMSRAPLVMLKPSEAFPRGERTLYDTTLGWRLVNPRMVDLGYHPIGLGETAENVAERYGVSRDEQDEYALGSHRRAVAAQDAGRFVEEIVPVRLADGSCVERDEHPRRDTTLDKLAKLKPAFRAGGTVTAGNSSGINDGAAAVLIVSAAKARELRLVPFARIVASAVAGVHPDYMGIGPIPATRAALRRADRSMAQVDLVELNEAFAAQVLPCVRELGIDGEKLNVNGGAIALGHPVGASGARMTTTLVHEMARRKAKVGLATMCIGVGQGIATVFERVA
ncbi:MAG TPA: thiolase family protein [Candidatus Dormibacteraeota bacterium]|nr:thiolase family protein [Candidatus Dormibacteraeota bacterium]